MRFWRRMASVQLGHNKYALDDLDFGFDVKIEDKPKASTAQITMTNLSPSTRAGIAKGMPVVLCAGYQGDVGTLFVGNVQDFEIDTQDIDSKTSIKVVDSLDEWLGARVNKTYKPKTRASEILDDLLEIFGVEVARKQLAHDQYYPRGRVCQGRLKDVLTQIVVGDCKSRLLIRTGQIIINPPDQGVDMGYLLTPETGLLKGKKQQESQSTNSSAAPASKTRAEQAEQEGGLSRSCLLNYRIGCADVVAIQDSETSGQYIVRKLQHVGSQGGDWMTTMEVTPV